MKGSHIAAIIGGMLLFMAYVIYATVVPVQVECEVCLEFTEEVVCRSGRGATEEEALTAAQESACGGNVTGMAELIACRNQRPVSSQCEGP